MAPVKQTGDRQNPKLSPDSLETWRSRSTTPANVELGGSRFLPISGQNQTTDGVTEPSTPVFRGTSPVDTNVAVMTADAANTDERIADLKNKIVMLLKILKEKDQQITYLKGKTVAQDDPESSEEQPYPPGFTPRPTTINTSPTGRQQINPVQAEPTHVAPSTSVASLSVQQLQDMIANTIKLQQDGLSQSSQAYAKPYLQRIERVRM